MPLCCIGERKALWKASLVNGDKYPLNQQDFYLNSDEKSPEVSFMLVPVLKVLLQEVKAWQSQKDTTYEFYPEEIGEMISSRQQDYYARWTLHVHNVIIKLSMWTTKKPFWMQIKSYPVDITYIPRRRKRFLEHKPLVFSNKKPKRM